MKCPQTLALIAVGMFLGMICGACTGGQIPAPASATLSPGNGFRELKPVVEALYLKTREFQTVYSELRTLAQGHVLGAKDVQLNYLQKTALYVQHACENADHQWQLFSILDYIKPSAMADYLNLRNKALKRATHELKYDRQFLQIYGPFITHPDAQREIQRALGYIDDIQALYDRLLKSLAPVVYKEIPTPT